MGVLVGALAGARGEPTGLTGGRDMVQPDPGMPEVTKGRPMESLVGHLLVAAPVLRDPNFERTVVLLVAHEDGGALGVVLNRATEVPVGEVLGGWGELASDPSVVFEGGPVQPEAAICLARVRSSVGEMKAFSRIEGTIGTIDLTCDPDTMRGELVELRVFAGYAGWSPGQLEEEIATGSWLTFKALPSDPFTERPDDLWGMVLRRQGGMQAAVALYPPDPTLN
jgi:putative transcriptional regulator